MSNNRILLFVLILIAFLFSVYQVLTRVDWVKLFHVDEKADQIEASVSDSLWEQMQNELNLSDDTGTLNALDTIVTKLCVANSINRDKIKLHLNNSEDVNAFALLGGHLVVNTQLIAVCDSQQELAGVIAHEIAHIQRRHLLNKFIKQAGISIVLTTATGSSSVGKLVTKFLHLITSTAFDRELETEADLQGADYMYNANINPKGMSTMMLKFSEMFGEKEQPKITEYVSTHPDSQKRSDEIQKHIKQFTKKIFSCPLSVSNWENLKANYPSKN